MKYLRFLALALVGASASASAQDSPRSAARSSSHAPAVNWTGFYLGGQAGFGWSRFLANDRNWDGGFTQNSRWLHAGFQLPSDGFIGGFQGGYQRQYGSFVAGLEIAGLSGLRTTIVSPYYPRSDRETGKTPVLATAGLRLGYALDRFLPYLKAGYAGGQVKFIAQDSSTPASFRHNVWQHGWMADAGVDYALTPNWIVGLDYTHADLGSKTKTGFTNRGTKEIYRTSVEARMLTLKVNYLFGGAAAPARAR